MPTVLEGQRYIASGLRIVRIQKDENGAIHLLLHDRIRANADGHSESVVYNKHHTFCVKPNGDMESDTMVDNARMHNLLQNKSMRGNNPDAYEAFAVLYDGLEKRNQAFALDGRLEDKSVEELMKAMDKIRLEGKQMDMIAVSGAGKGR